MFETPLPVFQFDAIDSTQDEARRQLALQGVNFWVRASEQLKGRGRRGREWISARGNYYASLVLPLPENRADAPKFGFIAVLALYEALNEFGVPHLSIKWPNDLLMNEKKIAGILLETEGEALIIGIGVNLTNAPQPESLQNRALKPASLGDFDIEPDRFHQLLESHFAKISENYQQYGFKSLQNALTMRLWLRSELVYDDGNGEQLVKVDGIGDDGALIVKTPEGQKQIFAGDLWPVEK